MRRKKTSPPVVDLKKVTADLKKVLAGVPPKAACLLLQTVVVAMAAQHGIDLTTLVGHLEALWHSVTPPPNHDAPDVVPAITVSLKEE
jgi:hypothetical protein